MYKKLVGRSFMLVLFFGCLKFYLLSPVYVLSDIFYYMPKSVFDDYGGERRRGMVWFPITRLKHTFDCV